jgi:putative endonuclease
MDRQPCTYILASGRNGTIYIGVTSDLIKRLHQHRHGDLSGFTSKCGVAKLVQFEMFDDMLTAIEREKQLKRWRREWKLNLIEQDNPAWDDFPVELGFEPLPACPAGPVDAETSSA